MSSTLIHYVLKAAIRDRIVLSVLLLIVLGTCLSVFMGSSAIVEKSDFALVYTSGGLRFLSVLGLVLFIVFHVRRSFETKDVEYLLSRPISRVSFLLSHVVAFSLLAVCVGLAVCVSVCLVAPHSIGFGHFLWGSSLLIELIIMANAALFFALVLPSAATGALATLSFYVLSRMIGQLMGITAIGGGFAGQDALAFLMKMISLLIPRLDLMGQSSWLVYPPDESVGLVFLLLQGALFTVLIICAALIDLIKRQF
jgi:hypothetical protein